MATLCHLIDNAAQRFGDKTALQIKRGYRADQWSYRYLLETSEQIAAHFANLGIQRGDRVLILAPNMPEWVGLFMGSARAGVILVPLDVRSSQDFMKKVADRTEARCFFVSRLVERQAPEIGVRVHYLEDLTEQVKNLPIDSGLPYPAEDDIAEIIFTSGTTGDPKGVILTHRNIVTNVTAANQAVPSKPEYRVLSLLPLSHMLEQTVGLFTPFTGGATVVYASSLQPSTIFKTLQEERIATMVVVPQVLKLFWQGIEREVERQGKQQSWQRMLRIAAFLPMPFRRLAFRSVHKRLGGNLQFITTGGAHLDPELARQWELIGIPILQGYGTTETAPIITAGTIRARTHDSVGKILPGQEIRIADDGEILTKGPNVTQGYWRSPESTKAAFDGEWYMTGDIGEIDSQGFLRLRGRKKDLIVLDNGMNVYPLDIEEALKSQAGVADAAVIGLSGRDGKTAVHAALLLGDSNADPKAIVASVNAGLADHQRVRDFTVWPDEDFPRTHTLKVKKQEIADFLAQGGHANAPTESLSRTVDAPELYSLISRIAGVPANSLTPHLNLNGDLALDSLRVVELLSAIEDELGVYVDESQISESTTVKDLERHVSQTDGKSQRPTYWEWPLNTGVSLTRAAFQSLVALPIARLYMPSKVYGIENLRGIDGPVMFASNHLSHLDTPAVVSAMPLRWRTRVAVAAAADVWFEQGKFAAFVGAFLFNAFPFSRTGNIRPTLEHTSRLLGKGWSILIYPEGTRSNDGRMGPFKSGTGLMGVEMGVPVVPVHIQGTYEVMNKNSRRPKRHNVSVRFGKPLCFTSGTPYEDATRSIECAVWSLGHAETPPEYAAQG